MNWVLGIPVPAGQQPGMKTAIDSVLLTESGNYNSSGKQKNMSTIFCIILCSSPNEKTGGTEITWRDANLCPASALPELLQIGTLKKLHFFLNLSDSLFSYNFSSISSIGKNLSNITRLGG
jgi:hypothetical protein